MGEVLEQKQPGCFCLNSVILSENEESPGSIYSMGSFTEFILSLARDSSGFALRMTGEGFRMTA